MKLGKRIAAGVLACSMAMSMLTACGGGGGGGGGNGGASSGGSGTSTPSASSGSSSGTLTPSSSGSDVNMGGGAISAYENSRTKALISKYASGPITMDLDIVANADYGTDKSHYISTSSGADNANTYTKQTHNIAVSTGGTVEGTVEEWDKNGTVYYYSDILSQKYWADGSKIIIEITPDVKDLFIEGSSGTVTVVYPEDKIVKDSFVALGMQSAPSSFTDSKKYYAEQFDWNINGIKLNTTFYFDGTALAYASSYTSTGEKMDEKVNSFLPTFDSSKMTVGGDGYRIAKFEEYCVKKLTMYIDPDNTSGSESEMKSLIDSSDFLVKMITYLRSLDSPSAETTAWLDYYGAL